MPDRPPTACKVCGRGSCKDHVEKKHQPYNAKTYADDPVDKLYRTQRWLRFAKTVVSLNPICQHLINGRQCMNPSKVVHHLTSPRVDPSRFLDPANVAAVCPDCHSGTEGETRGFTYLPTRWITLTF